MSHDTLVREPLRHRRGAQAQAGSHRLLQLQVHVQADFKQLLQVAAPSRCPMLACTGSQAEQPEFSASEMSQVQQVARTLKLLRLLPS